MVPPLSSRYRNRGVFCLSLGGGYSVPLTEKLSHSWGYGSGGLLGGAIRLMESYFLWVAI